MPASSTDVRAWAREQGHQVPSRGSLPQHLKDEYDAAHPGPVVQGDVLERLDESMGVTEADFPTDDYPDDPAGDTAAFDAAEKSTTTRPRSRERKPRAVKPPPAKGGIRERIFGGTKTGAKPKHAKGPRVSLSDWAEETWEDLAWLAQPIPPLAKILTIQAPYAGVVFDDQVKGTVVDSFLQPVAQYSEMFRALNGLAGPPVYVGLICATGARVQPMDPETGKPAVDAAGNPVLVYDQRTQMLFQGLRYSLLQMTKISEVNADQIQARVQVSVERQRAVDVMIASIFEMPGPGAPQASPPSNPPRGSGGGDQHQNGFRYPEPPTMDMTGADPGRL